MEVPKGSERKMTVCLLELLGTALFVYGILINGADNAGVALSLFASVVLLGGVTGGHFNPAVTIGVYLAEAKFATNFLFMIEIIISQCIGGLIAIAMAYPSLYDSATGKPVEGWTVKLCPKYFFTADAQCDAQFHGHYHLTLNTLVNEIVCTFIFVSVILMVKNASINPNRDGIAGALAVVATLMGMIKTGMRLGACFNPAVGLAVIINQNLWLTNEYNYLTHYTFAYTAGPAIGGVAAGLFHLIHQRLHPKVEEDQATAAAAGATYTKSPSQKGSDKGQYSEPLM